MLKRLFSAIGSSLRLESNRTKRVEMAQAVIILNMTYTSYVPILFHAENEFIFEQ